MLERGDKRGQGLSVNAIILIVLGVLVLVVLIVGFTIGWDKIAPWISSSNNVDIIVKACATACSTNSVYDYCSDKRELNVDDTTLKDVTCYYLSEKQPLYGVEKCGTLCSETVILDQTCASVEDSAGKTSQTFVPGTNTLDHTLCE